MDNVERELYIKALKLWGTQAQINMLFEEMAELQQAVCKLTRKDEDPIDNVIEEIVDVEIMLNQLKIMLQLKQQDLWLLKVKKLSRLKVLIDHERGGRR